MNSKLGIFKYIIFNLFNFYKTSNFGHLLTVDYETMKE